MISNISNRIYACIIVFKSGFRYLICFCDETSWAGTLVTPLSEYRPDEDSEGCKYEFPGKNWAAYFTCPEDAIAAEPGVVIGRKK